MLRLLLVFLCLWIFHSRAHLESEMDFINFPHESVTSDDTPVSHGEIAGSVVPTGNRAWRAPNYQDQPDAVGYSSDVFQTPKGLERAVQFWTDIYTKYPSTQGVIHDSENIDLVYETVDFKDVENDKGLSPRERDRAKKKLVNSAKVRVSDLLRKLNTHPDPQTLSAQEKRVYDYFKKIEDPDKYTDANDKNRIRFQLGQADRMQTAIYFSGRYLEEFEKVFREEKLPVELTRLVFVESSFNVLARSKVGATGLWQIMPSVARPKHMINPYVDGRNDPWEATKLAAQILSGNYKLLGKWPLAVTGYNHGPNGVKKMTLKYRTEEISDLVQNVRSKRNFGFASRNFYASFLAALGVEKNAKAYFPDIQWSDKLKSTTYKVKMALPYADLVKVFDNDRQQLEIFNPHLTAKVKAQRNLIPAGTKLYVPSDKLALLEKGGRRVATDSPRN